MVGTHPSDGAAAVGLTPAQRVILPVNLLRAVRTYTTELAVLEMLEIAGPSTTADLVVYARYRLPAMSQTTLQRILTRLRGTMAITVYHLGQRRVLWALPGQPKPVTKRAPAPRRREPPPPPRTSWWLDQDRETFYQTVHRRWPA